MVFTLTENATMYYLLLYLECGIVCSALQLIPSREFREYNVLLGKLNTLRIIFLDLETSNLSQLIHYSFDNLMTSSVEVIGFSLFVFLCARNEENLMRQYFEVIMNSQNRLCVFKGLVTTIIFNKI